MNLFKRAAALGVSCLMLGSMAAVMPAAAAESSGVKGDVNGDGVFTVADVVLLQEWLFGKTKDLADWKAADLVSDNKLDAFDLALMRKMLFERPVPEGYSGLVINEVCTGNKNSLKDSTGASPDWIELYNSGSETVDLSGVGLSDGKKNRYKFAFPAGTKLNSGEYVLVLCDDTDTVNGTEFHAPFKLSSSGETVYLTSPAAEDGTSGSDIDIVEVPELPTDITYGRKGSGAKVFDLLTPTPAAENTSEAAAVAMPVFSEEGGFYDSEFDLTLSGKNEILYTLDGSDPRTSSTAAVYDGAIKIYDNTSESNKLAAVKNISLYGYNPPNYKIDKGIIVRAVSKDGEGQFSEVATNSYFVNKTASYYKDMKVLSISTDAANFFDNDKGIYMIGSQYHNTGKNPGDKDNPTNYNGQGKEWERPCNIQVFENGKLKFTEDVGVRIAGAWSTAHAQKSLTFYARSEYGSKKMKYDFFEGNARDMDGSKIKEYKRVTVRNGGNDYNNARIRDDLNQYLAAGLDLSTQAKYDYVVFLDGEFWGYYSMQEKLDDNYIESHYHIDSDDVTIIKVGKLDEGSEETYKEYESFWNWAKSADMTDADNYAKVCEAIDIQSFIDYVAVQSYIVNWDCLWNINNWMMWRSDVIDESNPYADGRWRFMLYDTEYSANLSDTTTPNINYFSKIDKSWKISSIGSLWHSLMKNEEFSEAFRSSFNKIATENFSADRATAKISEYSERLNTVIGDTFKRFGVSSDFRSKLKSVSSFFSQRQSYALQQLEKYGASGGEPDKNEPDKNEPDKNEPDKNEPGKGEHEGPEKEPGGPEKEPGGGPQHK